MKQPQHTRVCADHILSKTSIHMHISDLRLYHTPQRSIPLGDPSTASCRSRVSKLQVACGCGPSRALWLPLHHLSALIAALGSGPASASPQSRACAGFRVTAGPHIFQSAHVSATRSTACSCTCLCTSRSDRRHRGDAWAMRGRRVGDAWATRGRRVGDGWATRGRCVGDAWATDVPNVGARRPHVDSSSRLPAPHLRAARLTLERQPFARAPCQ